MPSWKTWPGQKEGANEMAGKTRGRDVAVGIEGGVKRKKETLSSLSVCNGKSFL